MKDKKNQRISKRGIINEGRPKAFQSVKELERKIEEFFELCETENKPVTITRLARILECERHLLSEYKKDSVFSSSIKKALQACQEYAEDRLFTSQQCTGAIFTLKNNYGWRDQQNIEGKFELNYNVKPVKKEDEK